MEERVLARGDGHVTATGLSHSGETTRQHLRLGVVPHLVQQAHGVVGDEVLRAEPAQLVHQISNMIIFFAAENDFCCVVKYFLYPRDILCGTGTVYCYRVSQN